MSQVRPIVAFLSFIGLFFTAVLPISVHMLFGTPLASSVFGVAFTAYWVGCCLCCFSFLRGAALVGVAVGVHVLMGILLMVDLMHSHTPVLILAVPVWLLFVALFAVMIVERLKGSQDLPK